MCTVSDSADECWFCRKQIVQDDYYRFSWEYDTYIHEKCIQKQLKKYLAGDCEGDYETEIILSEFDLI